MKCKKCDIEKNNEDFSKNRRVCKECEKKRYFEWKINNLDKISANSKKYRENNREICRKRCLDHYEKNKWKYREYRHLNPDAHRNYSKKYRTKNVENIRKRKKELEKLYRLKQPKEHKARKLLYQAVKLGKIFRSNECVMCGEKCKTEAHHRDYERPLEVVWVCRLCHAGLHTVLKRNNK